MTRARDWRAGAVPWYLYLIKDELYVFIFLKCEVVNAQMASDCLMNMDGSEIFWALRQGAFALLLVFIFH